ncbi:DUF1700 domain-containing protein [Arthrobacter sp.]|uniref:DUF1700 domain-containing protein n=1 Tax=Arthrobacter sp. TaxID=1667 RepID=UPI0026E05F60|nr:hypothetical protein [Arthrobacter sp.]MDO5753260.1 hypothetical protein [Arthrobacter sp.]
MMNRRDEQEVQQYLSALEARLSQLPTDQSEEILFGVREHITEAVSRGDRPVSEVLASLGSPDDVLAEMVGLDDGRKSGGVRVTTTPRWRSTSPWVAVTVVLLAFGGFLLGVGWFAGLACLWMGTRWKTWEKVIGTVLFPGGVLGALYFARLIPWRADLAPEAMNTGPVEPVIPGLPLTATILIMIIPLIMAGYLLVAGLLRQPPPATASSAALPSMLHN